LLNNLAIMKTLKSALLGAKSLEDTDMEVLMTQVTEIIKQHRAIIIQRLLSDLPTYLDYKFQVNKPTKIQLEHVKDELLALKNSGVELNYYTAVVHQLQTRAIVHLTNEPFYVEIDAAMQHHLETTKHFSLNTQPAAL
jgi:hypothetical protein